MRHLLWFLRGIVCFPWCMWDCSRPQWSYNRTLDKSDATRTHPLPLRRRLRMAWTIWKARYWIGSTLDLFDALCEDHP